MHNSRLTHLPSSRETVVGFCFLVFQIFFLGSVITEIGMALGIPISNLGVNLIYFSIAAAAVLLIFRKFHRANFAKFRGNAKQIVKAALLTLPIYYAISLTVNNAIELCFPDFFNRNNDTLNGMLGKDFPLALFMAVVLAPIVEETLHRGMIFGALSKRSRPVAYAVSAGCFIFIHVVGYLSSLSALELLLSALQYIPASIIFCLLYEKTDCLWAPMLLHAGVNLVSCIALRFTGG